MLKSPILEKGANGSLAKGGESKRPDQPSGLSTSTVVVHEKLGRHGIRKYCNNIVCRVVR
jgi:hypothetical protein